MVLCTLLNCHVHGSIILCVVYVFMLINSSLPPWWRNLMVLYCMRGKGVLRLHEAVADYSNVHWGKTLFVVTHTY